MNLDISLITNNALVIVPIVIALVQAIKLTGWVSDHFTPLVSLGVGILIAFLIDHDNTVFTMTILSGAIYGLMASGLYSGVKTTMVAHARMKEMRAKNEINKKDNC